MEKKLIRIESRLQSLIEGTAAKLFSADETNLTQRLMVALKDSITPGQNNEYIAADVFVLEISETQALAIQNDPQFLAKLAQSLQLAATEQGIRFKKQPEIQIQSNSQFPPGELRVVARASEEKLPRTTAMEVGSENEEIIPKNAYLIVDGMDVIQLNHLAVNIGRRADNQVIVNDQRVSRLHAQLRVVNGAFVIFDLDSKGGTFVNGKRIHQHTLRPGDVISLSGVPIIFGQDAPEDNETRNFHKNDPEAC